MAEADLVPSVDELLANSEGSPIDIASIVEKVVAIITQAVTAINVNQGETDNTDLIRAMSIPAIVVLVTELVEWVLSVLPA